MEIFRGPKSEPYYRDMTPELLADQQFLAAFESIQLNSTACALVWGTDGRIYPNEAALKAFSQVDFKAKKLTFKLEYNKDWITDEPIRYKFSAFASHNKIFNKGIIVIEPITSVNDFEQKAFKKLVEQLPVAACIFTTKQLLVYAANDKMLSYWGVDRNALLKPLIEVVPVLKDQPFIGILKRIFDTGENYTSTEAPAILERNGVTKTYFFDYTYHPLKDETGKVYGILNVATDVTERVRLNRKAKAEQDQFFDLFENTSIAIAILNIDLVIEKANPFYLSLINKRADEVIDKPILEAIPEFEGQGFDNLLREVITSKESYSAQAVKVDLFKDGVPRTIYIDLTYQPLVLENGDVDGVFLIATDVTQKVLAKAESASKETTLRSILEHAAAGISLFVGRELVFELPNKKIIELLGKGPDVEGRRLTDVMPELLTENQPIVGILHEVFDTGVAFSTQETMVKIVHDGVLHEKYYNFTYTPLFNDQNEVYAILQVAIEVTEAVQSKKKILEAQSALERALGLAELATWRYNLKTKELTGDNRFNQWFFSGDQTDENYKGFRDFLVKIENSALTKQKLDNFKGEHTKLDQKTGQRKTVLSSAELRFDAENEAIFIDGTSQDVTVLRQKQNELEKLVEKRTRQLEEVNSALEETNQSLENSNKELAQFAYVASHDLQEPLRKISTFVKMLSSHLTEKDQRTKSYIDRIMNSSDRMSNLIHDVLGYSQLSKGETKFAKTNLNIILKEVLHDFELVIEQKAASITTGKMPVIEGIPIQLSQLFANLISNSIKYSFDDRSPVINITAEKISTQTAAFHGLSSELHYYKFTIVDNGIGFSTEYSEQIFNIFQRLHGKLEYEGTGIGLAMCRKIYENHRGAIHAHGIENIGATFEIFLPEKQRSIKR